MAEGQRLDRRRVSCSGFAPSSPQQHRRLSLDSAPYTGYGAEHTESESKATWASQPARRAMKMFSFPAKLLGRRSSMDCSRPLQSPPPLPVLPKIASSVPLLQPRPCSKQPERGSGRAKGKAQPTQKAETPIVMPKPEIQSLAFRKHDAPAAAWKAAKAVSHKQQQDDAPSAPKLLAHDQEEGQLFLAAKAVQHNPRDSYKDARDRLVPLPFRRAAEPSSAAHSPHTPDAGERRGFSFLPPISPPDSEPDERMTRLSSTASSVALAKETLERLITNEPLPLLPKQDPSMSRMGSHSDLKRHQMGKCFSAEAGPGYPSTTTVNPTVLGGPKNAGTCAVSAPSIAEQLKSLEKVNAVGNESDSDSGALIQPEEFPDTESESEDSQDQSILDVADSQELEQISIAAATRPLSAKVSARHRPAQDTASDLHSTAPQLQTDTSRFSTEKPPRIPTRRNEWQSPTSARASLPVTDLFSNPGLRSPQNDWAPWPTPRPPAHRRTSLDPTLAGRIAGRIVGNLGEGAGLESGSESTWSSPRLPSPSPSPRRISEDLPPVSKQLYQTCQAELRTEKPKPKAWVGLGQTQAALAQLEWQNRKLSHKAARLHKRATEAEARVAQMSQVEQKCAQLSQEKERLLRRLLRLVSPSEAERLMDKEAILDKRRDAVLGDDSNLRDKMLQGKLVMTPTCKAAATRAVRAA